MLNIEKEIERLQDKYPDIGGTIHEQLKREAQKELDLGLPRYGTVVDNKDPQFLGRVRVAADTIAPGAVTPWIPVIALGAGRNMGWWQLPDIGSQVLMAFVGKGHSNPIVIGNIHDLKNRPPKHSTAKARDSKLYQTKNHRMEFIEEEGRESLIISTAEGKMALILDKKEGIKLINELGDIRIRCRKLTIHGKNIKIEGKKRVIISAGKGTIKAGKSIKIACEKEVKIKGKSVKLQGRRGVTSEGRQLAAQGDKVMGFDIHQMRVPSGRGTSVVPLPHPFIGKLADRLSSDVKINRHNAATKGSIARHDSPIHHQLPGTIRFERRPSREGEVTGNTGKKLKINGKEAALVGSTVTSCNDIGARDHSTILAPGASFPMPVIINPKNTEAWKKEQEAQKKIHPSIIDSIWSIGGIKEGGVVELIALVHDIADGTPVVFRIFGSGQDPNSHIALYELIGIVEGGAARVPWKYSYPQGRELPEADPCFIFVAYCAWSKPKQSAELTIELNRPEVNDGKWIDDEAKGTGEGFAGKEIKLQVSCNKDVQEGAPVVFQIFADGADTSKDKPVDVLLGSNKEGKAIVGWTYKYRHDPENPLKEKPKFFFTANSPRCKEVRSAKVEISARIDIVAKDEKTQKIMDDTPFDLFLNDEFFQDVTSDDEGEILLEDLIPGKYSIMPKKKKEKENGE